MNRFLLSIPVLFAASITAAACSSSSSGGAGPGVDSGSGTANPDCATLAVCCSTFTGTAEMQCNSVVTNGGANCTTQLNSAKAHGACTGTTGGKDAGTGTPDTGTTGGHDSSTGKPDTGMTGNPDGSSAGGTCAAPTAPPFGFAPPTGIVGTGCSTSQTTELGQDQVTDGGGNFSTVVSGGAPDGSLNSCGSCLEATVLIPGQAVPTVWGAFELFAPEATAGDPSSAFGPFNAQLNLGGCIYAADPTTAGKKCGLDVMALDACGLSTCLALCAVGDSGNSSSDFNDLFTCVNTAEEGAACAQYFTAFQTDCGAVHNDAGTGAFDQCAALVDQDEEIPEAGTPTAMTESEYFGLICGGGVDAGL